MQRPEPHAEATAREPASPAKVEAPEQAAAPTFALDFCDVDVTWKTRADLDLSSWKQAAECGDVEALVCMTPDEASSLLCHCPWASHGSSISPTYVQPESKDFNQNRDPSNAVFFFWATPESMPMSISVPTTLPERDEALFSVAEEDLDLDGHPELLLSVRGVYNTIGRVYMHRVILDGADRSKVLGLHVFQPEFETPQAAEDFYAMHQILLEGGDVDGQARGCLLMEFDYSTEGNGCNGCAAGGPTGTSYVTYRYKAGRIERVGEHQM